MKGAKWTAWACSIGIVMASYGGAASAATAKPPAPSPAPAAAKAPSPPPAPAPKPPAPPAPVAKSAAAPVAAMARQAAALPPMAPPPKPASPAAVAATGAAKLVPAQAAAPGPSAGQQSQPPRAPLSNPPVLPGAAPSAKVSPAVAMTPPPRPASPGPAPMSAGRAAGVTAAAVSKLNFAGLPSNAQRQLAAPAQQFAHRAASVQIVREPTTSGWTWLFLAWALSESSKSHRLAEERAAMQTRMNDLERELRRDPAQWSSLQDTSQRLQQTMPPAEWGDDGEPELGAPPASASASASATASPGAFSDQLREQLGDPLSDGLFNKVLVGLALAMGLSVGLLGMKYALE